MIRDLIMRSNSLAGRTLPAGLRAGKRDGWIVLMSAC
jgi:hypothetical protein